MTSPTAPHHTNRLAQEKSPYLLQHANNPVDWYPWGEEAFARARQEDKPVFLSIGYSTCHWCHVMERESFENPEIARLMNELFINIKVDREEHPDVDQVYMGAVMLMTGQGGWPLTAFLTPDLKPFFGGTYFPPERRWQVAGMKEVLPAVAQAWKARRAELTQAAEQLTSSLGEQLGAAPEGSGTPDAALLDAAFGHADSSFDAALGGFGQAPKFPRGHELSFLLRYWSRAGNPRALEMVTTTLDRLAAGGIHDHLGGGFHRYSTDAEWLVPHFEKMLYDQALLALAYLEAYRVTRKAVYAGVARGIFAYVARDLTDPRGGFYSAEDADSEGHEGKFYVWTPPEIVRILGAEDGARFSNVYGVTREGNFELGSILHTTGPEDGAAPGLEAMRATLLAARSARVRPHRDDKILTSWNGLMIAALAYGASTLDEPAYLDQAQRAARFLLESLVRDGVLLRRYRDGEARYPGTLEDYAYLAHGLFELYEASLDPAWLAETQTLVKGMVERFWDEEGAGFFLRSREEAPLIVRSKELYDGATPSGNSMALTVLVRLARLTADATLEALARRAIEAFTPSARRAPFGHPQFFSAVDFALGPTQEIVVAGDPSHAATRQLLRELHDRFLPRSMHALRRPGTAGRDVASLIPYAAAQDALQGRPTAYVCHNFICDLPVTDARAFAAALDQGGRRP